MNREDLSTQQSRIRWFAYRRLDLISGQYPSYNDILLILTLAWHAVHEMTAFAITILKHADSWSLNWDANYLWMISRYLQYNHRRPPGLMGGLKLPSLTRPPSWWPAAHPGRWTGAPRSQTERCRTEKQLSERGTAACMLLQLRHMRS